MVSCRHNSNTFQERLPQHKIYIVETNRRQDDSIVKGFQRHAIKSIMNQPNTNLIVSKTDGKMDKSSKRDKHKNVMFSQHKEEAENKRGQLIQHHH